MVEGTYNLYTPMSHDGLRWLFVSVVVVLFVMVGLSTAGRSRRLIKHIKQNNRQNKYTTCTKNYYYNYFMGLNTSFHTCKTDNTPKVGFCIHALLLYSPPHRSHRSCAGAWFEG